jgi:hypothetical protein
VKVTLHRSGQEDVIAHVPDRSFFPLQVHMGDRVVARWAVEDVHILRVVGERPYAQAVTPSLPMTLD